VLSSVVFCEIAAWCSAHNTTIWKMLMEIYTRCGLYHEALVSITMKGLDGLKQINEKMIALRSAPPHALGGSPVVEVRDIQERMITNLKTGQKTQVDLPSSNVLQFILEDGSKISARPSGTEPKIKFYFSLKEKFGGAESYRQQVAQIEKRIKTIQQEIGL
jgi:phosphoglucomutase